MARGYVSAYQRLIAESEGLTAISPLPFDIFHRSSEPEALPA
jgi:hypothetical protein